MKKNKEPVGIQQMFRQPQGRLFDKSLEEERQARAAAPVECLGMTFPNDDARREYFLKRLEEKLGDPEFRRIEGFPIGEDEDILRLSDPPYYTACPNPFLGDLIRCYGKPYDASVEYHRTPLAVDVTEGKTDPLYKAHAYHTKVPHLAIVPSLLHYTQPGDVVLDGFCGSGMTGVASQWCGTAPFEYRRKIESQWKAEGRPMPEWGARTVLLGDLSPAATFIAANYNFPFDVDSFLRAGRELVDQVQHDIGWMYETIHVDGRTKGRVNYTVWSQVFTCPDCGTDIIFAREALHPQTKKVRKTFPCPHCDASLKKNLLAPSSESTMDPVTHTLSDRIRLAPALVNYTVDRRSYNKEPSAEDLGLLRKIASLPFPADVPTREFPFKDMWEAARLEEKGIRYTHQLFLPRSIHALATGWRFAEACADSATSRAMKIVVQHQFVTASLMNRYRPASSFGNAPIRGTYYVSSMIAEASVPQLLRGTVKRLHRMASPAWTEFASQGNQVAISTASASSLASLPAESIDYVFTDPPFGDNYPYWELNFLPESWHRVMTAGTVDAIVDRGKKNKVAQKGLPEYQALMEGCFAAYFRALKPGRWMTLVFSNSKNSVWHAIQEALGKAGFVVADVRTLDKKQRSFKQVTSSAPQQDLVISAYKPNQELEKRFELAAGSESGVWDFVRSHLGQLPLPKLRGDQLEPVIERQAHVLCDKMIGFHVRRGVAVPLSAADFCAGLSQRFPERDGMYFLPEQVPEYDRSRIGAKDLGQLELFVSDESSAIQWLRRELGRRPSTLQEFTPVYIREAQRAWMRHEQPLELKELLDQNFIRYDGEGEVPSQIHGYLSSNFKELRNLDKNDPALRKKAKDRWYVPDPKKAQDLEKVRERSLLREFAEYRESTQRKLKVFRTEAVRAGFKAAYDRRDYRTIVEVAAKLPDSVLHEDDKLLMYYDVATTRLGE